MVDACSEVNKEFPVPPARPCITHANFMTEEAIKKSRNWGSCSIVSRTSYGWMGHARETQLCNQRLTYFQPYNTLFENRITVGGGSDHMQKIGSLPSINPYNPFLGMGITLTRQPRWTDQPPPGTAHLARTGDPAPHDQ
jgi:predicted amidohydrolase YtcJ